MYQKVIITTILLFVSSFYYLSSQKCKDFLIFDGGEEVYSFGIDTTGNWWIFTKPYQNEFRLIINGQRTESYKEIKNLKFSPDGTRWAFFGKNSVNWNVVTSDTIIPIFAEDIVSLGFSLNSENLFFAYRNGLETTIQLLDKKFNITNFSGKIYINYSGTKIAFTMSFGKFLKLVVPNYFESERFDAILPLGFWSDDEFIYAGKKGNFWQIYKNRNPISEEFLQVIDMKINYDGTNAAFVAKRFNNDVVVVLFSEKYIEPIVSKPYDFIKSVKLHPKEPLVVFFATKDVNNYIVYGNVEYPLGNFDADPFFTHDGSEIFYCFCNIECYFFVDGKRYTLPGGTSCRTEIARKPSTNTIAFSNYTSLVLLDFFLNVQYSGMMVDKVVPPIYNWKKRRYEALGEINNKIYLLTCEP
ncbi:MAG: hypothetical protein N2560_01955 [Ignavibacteria bacterium]|nr:hypothetical protein [Ignavibacteria bacterium]